MLGSALRCTVLANRFPRKVVDSAFRWAALTSREAERSIDAYFLLPIRPRCVSWNEVGSFRP
jgi:hypothetical protein